MGAVCLVYARLVWGLKRWSQEAVMATGILLLAASIMLRHLNVGPLFDLSGLMLGVTFLMQIGSGMLLLHPQWAGIRKPWISGAIALTAAIIAVGLVVSQ